MLVLIGVINDDPMMSTFAFVLQAVGYDLVGFLNRNYLVIKTVIKSIVEKLLSV